MSASNPCPACGAANEPANLFCVNCGTRLPTAGPSGPMAPSAMPPAPPPAYAAAPWGPPTGTPVPPYPSPYTYPYVPAPPRPATFSEILGRMFDVWSKNFLYFFIVFLALGLTNGLLSGVLSLAIVGVFGPSGGFVPGSPPAGVTTASILQLVLLAVVTFVAVAIIDSIILGGMTDYAVRRHRGESVGLEQSLRRGFDRFLSILGARLLLAVLVVALVVVPATLAFFPFVLSAGTVDPGTALVALCGGILAFIVGGIVVLYVYIATVLYAPAIMMEGRGAVDGLRRSWSLMKGHWWTLFGAIVVIGLVQGVISAVLVFPVGLLGNPVLNIVAAAIAAGLVGAWLIILPAVAYDLILRQPTWSAPSYYPPPTFAPPVGAAQAQPPPAGPPPEGPPPPSGP